MVTRDSGSIAIVCHDGPFRKLHSCWSLIAHAGNVCSTNGQTTHHSAATWQARSSSLFAYSTNLCAPANITLRRKAQRHSAYTHHGSGAITSVRVALTGAQVAARTPVAGLRLACPSPPPHPAHTPTRTRTRARAPQTENVFVVLVVFVAVFVRADEGACLCLANPLKEERATNNIL